MDVLRPIFRLLKYTPILIWHSLISLVQLIIPRCWYAKDVSREVVLITGAGAGLGRALALEYAQLNASLVLWDVNAAGLRETKELVERAHAERRAASAKSSTRAEAGADADAEQPAQRFCLTYLVDVSDRESVYASAQQVQAELNARRGPGAEPLASHVSVLVNNAGIYYGKMLAELTDEQIERIFKINILAHFWTVRAFLPAMVEHERGHIVEIASMGGISGLHKQVDYCATKFATLGFEEALSMELAVQGLADKIRTTAICPFFFQSNLFTGFDSRAAPIMSVRHVARQAVLGMRCNHSRVLLPPRAHFINIFQPITPRRSLFLWAKIMSLTDGIRDIKGSAAS